MSYAPPHCLAVVEAEDRTEAICLDDRMMIVFCEDRCELVELEIRVEQVCDDVYAP